MGFAEKLMGIAFAGAVASDIVKESKKVCDDCGKIVKEGAKCREAHWYPKQGYVCDDCMKKCKKCGKFFCNTHIKKHKCN